MVFARAKKPLIALALGVLALVAAQAQEAGAAPMTLRERIQARLQERRAASKPAPSAADTPLQQAGTHRLVLRHGGQERAYLVHVPPQYRPGTPMPVLFALHGGGGNMEIQAGAHYGLLGLADQKGFLAVFPNGYSRMPGGKLATWNAGQCCGAARDSGSDDVGFVRAVAQQVAARWSVDRQRFFATGMSNGAMMAYRLACELPGTFAAIAAVAGTDNTVQCQPQRPVAVLHIHARDDTHVLFGGGAGADAFRDRDAVTDFTSVDETMRRWTQHNQCSGTPVRTLSVPGAYCDTYQACATGAPVRLCVTDTGGHSWPGGSKVRTTGGPAPSTAIRANEVLWDFFQQTAALSPPPSGGR
ncbi:MAG: extracellular catalytic domain type 1 short-chain-length polyhydroxyalkanoate depolymerase [Rhodoferax sp.]